MNDKRWSVCAYLTKNMQISHHLFTWKYLHQFMFANWDTKPREPSQLQTNTLFDLKLRCSDSCLTRTSHNRRLNGNNYMTNIAQISFIFKTLTFPLPGHITEHTENTKSTGNRTMQHPHLANFYVGILWVNCVWGGEHLAPMCYKNYTLSTV